MARASARAGKNTKPKKPLLSPRMKECAELMRAGLKTREIAKRMALSVATVSTYSKRIYAALGLRSRAELQALPMGDGELDRLRKELAEARKDRDRIKGMYEGLDGARTNVVTRNLELEAGLTTLQTGIREILAMPEDDDRAKFDEIFEGLPGAGLMREAFVEAMKGARMAGLSTSEKLADQLALLLSPTDAAELAKAKEDAARVNRLYDTAVDALCRTRADLVALQNELLELASKLEDHIDTVDVGDSLRAVAEGSQARARHAGAAVAPAPMPASEFLAEAWPRLLGHSVFRRVEDNQVFLEIASTPTEAHRVQMRVGEALDLAYALFPQAREVASLRLAWNVLDAAVSDILTSRTATWDTDRLRSALKRASLFAAGERPA